MATLTSALVDFARVRRLSVVGPRVEGASQTAVDFGDWFPARLVVGDAAESVDPQGGQRRVVVSGELIAAPGVDISAADEIEVSSSTLGSAVWRVVGAPAVIRTRSRARVVTVPLRRTEEATTPERATKPRPVRQIVYEVQRTIDEQGPALGIV